MKLLLQLLVFTLCFSAHLSAQTDTSGSSYLFEEFHDAIVFYNDGRQFAVPLNFNFNTGRYVFIDKADQQEKEFSNPNMVVALHVGERIFLMSEGKATEVIQAEPKFHVLYTAQKKKAPANVPYGGTSETASVDSYSGLAGQGVTNRAQANNRVVTGVDKTYEVQVGRRNRGFYNQRSFLRIFPKTKRAGIESYIEDHRVDFNSVKQVFQLYQYAMEQ